MKKIKYFLRFRVHLGARFSVLVLTLAFGLSTIPAGASTASLTVGEVHRLQELIKLNPNARHEYGRIKQIADSALGDMPSPVIHLVGQGRLPSDPERKVSQKSLRDVRKTEALAWVARLDSDERALTKAKEYLLAWSATNISDGNSIHETNFEGMIVGYDLIRDLIDPSSRAAIDNWMLNKAQKLVNSKRRYAENWQSHRLKIVGMIGKTLDNDDLWSFSINGLKQHVQNNYFPDGSSVDFLVRDALSYHIYSLEPLVTLACVARHDLDLYSYQARNGASLDKAVKFLVPYVEGKEVHLEYVKSEVAFDKQRLDAKGLAGKFPQFKPSRARIVFTEVGCIDTRYEELTKSLWGDSPAPELRWLSVRNEVMRSERNAFERFRKTEATN